MPPESDVAKSATSLWQHRKEASGNAMKDSARTPSNEPIPVPLLDVVRGNEPLRDQVLEAITKVVDSGWFLNGPDCRELEAEVARRCEVPGAVSCASGSDALLLQQ